jgi:hypothetical protein
MTNLHDRLSLIAGPAGAPSAEQVDEDLTRGRRALHRRRTFQKLGASGFAVAAVAVAVAYGTTAGSAGGVPADRGATVAQGGDASAATTTVLVAYHGDQPKGFTIDKVPSGWEVQGVSASALTIGPVGAKPHNSADPNSEVADNDPDSFVGKIAVMLQSKDDHSTPTGDPVTVAGKPGVISKGQGTDYGKNLWVKQPNGIWMEVQIWDARGWTNAAIVEFAGGIHVEKDAVQGVG